MKKVIIIVLAAAVVAALVAIFGVAEFKRQKESRMEKAENAATYNEEIHALWQEKRELEREIRDVEQRGTKAGSGCGNVVLLFAEPDLRLETEAFPLLAEHGYTGVIALSMSDFDDDAARLSDDRLKELQSEGWELCLSLGSSEDLAALCQAVRQAGLDMPQTLYLPETLLTESQSVIAQAQGITAVVQHSGSISGEICYALPCIMASGSHESLLSEEKKGLSKQLLLETVEKSGALVLTVGYNRVRDTYDENNFSAMLRSIDRYVKAGKLTVSNCVDAWSRLSATSMSAEDLEKQNREYLADLRQKLDEVNGRITELSK